jgi:hypothetical protein
MKIPKDVGSVFKKSLTKKIEEKANQTILASDFVNLEEQ